MDKSLIIAKLMADGKLDKLVDPIIPINFGGEGYRTNPILKVEKIAFIDTVDDISKMKLEDWDALTWLPVDSTRASDLPRYLIGYITYKPYNTQYFIFVMPDEDRYPSDDLNYWFKCDIINGTFSKIVIDSSANPHKNDYVKVKVLFAGLEDK